MTINQFWTMIGTMVVISSGAFGWVIWATKRLSRHDAKFEFVDKWITQNEVDHKAEVLEREVESKATSLAMVGVQKELMQTIHDGHLLLFSKLDLIKEDTGKMQVNCGRHDERLKQLEKEK
jgi:hypothetical protein